MHQIGLAAAPVIILGDAQPSGVYLLRLHIQQPLAVVCGRFKADRPLFFAPGDYLYIGSALGIRGASTLAHRLVRHATRSGARPPQALRAVLLECCKELGMDGDRGPKPRVKKLFWHVDYVLDDLAVELRQVFTLRTTRRLEPWLAQQFALDACTFVVEKGLGASDYPGATHLLGVKASEAWWAAWVERLQDVLVAG